MKDAARKVVELCHSRGTSAPTLAVQFAVQHPYVSTTFVGLSSVEEARHTLQAISEQPDPESLREIDRLSLQYRARCG